MKDQKAPDLHTAVRTVATARSKAIDLLKYLANGMTNKHGEEGKKKFLSEIKLQLDTINNSFKELDQILHAVSPIPSTPSPVGHTVYLGYDPSADATALYSNSVATYKWLDKSRTMAGTAATFVSSNSLVRTHGKHRGKRGLLSTQNPQALDAVILNLLRLYGDMTFTVTRPNESKLTAIVHVSLERILSAVLMFKCLHLEYVVVRGYKEDTGPNSDVWTESACQVFRMVSDNANAAMLNFHNPNYPELAVKSFVTYLHSFSKLFTDKCRKCGNHLFNNLPPTWREFKTLEPYHEDCRPL